MFGADHPRTQGDVAEVVIYKIRSGVVGAGRWFPQSHLWCTHSKETTEMRKVIGGLMTVALVLTVVGVASAGPVVDFTATFVNGNTCPTDAYGPFTGNERQYQVADAIKCMWIDTTNTNTANPTGGPTDTNNFLNGQDAFDAGWTTALSLWTGLGSDEQVGGLDGFSFTGAGSNSGSFTIGSPLTDSYNQFAVAVKDGGDPKFAIFLLAEDDFSSLWSILSNGTLSHFAVYGHNVGSDDPPLSCPDGSAPPCPFIGPTEVPEPMSMMLLGGGLLVGVAKKYRNSRKA
jgi:hypothetical protein